MDDTIRQYLAENGRRGGNTTLQRKGKDFFKQIAKLAVQARKNKASVAK